MSENADLQKTWRFVAEDPCKNDEKVWFFEAKYKETSWGSRPWHSTVFFPVLYSPSKYFIIFFFTASPPVTDTEIKWVHTLISNSNSFVLASAAIDKHSDITRIIWLLILIGVMRSQEVCMDLTSCWLHFPLLSLRLQTCGIKGSQKKCELALLASAVVICSNVMPLSQIHLAESGADNHHVKTMQCPLKVHWDLGQFKIDLSQLCDWWSPFRLNCRVLDLDVHFGGAAVGIDFCVPNSAQARWEIELQSTVWAR